MRLIGRPAWRLRHKDYLQDVPLYRYNLPCGHNVSYQIPVELNDFGYCYLCHEYFQHDGVKVTEIRPRNRRRRLSDSEIFTRVDQAIIRNRIAYLLTNGCTYGVVVSLVPGASYMTVRRVGKDLGGWRSMNDFEQMPSSSEW